MRIVVWNINGLRTLKGYQPWYKLSDWEACLEHLSADIACFQETKMTRKQLTEPMCILPSYNAFFNFHPTKGYSGTVTYVRKSVSIPLKAEQGITGRLTATNVSSSSRGAIPDEPIGCIPADTRDDVEPQVWNALDEEGRCVVLDLGMFVLFNVYCPNETGPERLEYKMTYYQCLAERAHRLIAAGREVMIVGDMNIIRDSIDHCDPEQSLKEHGWSHFHQHPARSWFQTFLAPQGKFHDVGRTFHPKRQKMFTCWNTLIDARPANYGVRLDYTLVTEGLLEWVKGADIQADVYGSDHCPIYIDLFDEREIDGKIVRLRDLMHGGESRLPPALAACYYEEFSGRQRKLASFFGAKKQPASAAEENKGSAEPTLSTPSQVAVTTEERSDAANDLTAATQDDSDGGSLAESLFSLHAQQEGIDVQAPTQLSRSTAEARPTVESTPPTSAPLTSTPTSASQPSPNRRSLTSPKRAPSISKGKDTSKAKNGAALKGQTSLQSFFAKPTSSTPAPTPPTATCLPPHTPALNGNSSSTSTRTAVDVVSDDDDDEISAFPPFTACSQPLEPEPEREPSAAGRVDASLAWGAIFSPLPAPLCRLHSEPCRAWTVNKPGPNHGRKFWLCSRPVGPGYEKSGRAKGDVNPEFRCNFFLWDSDLRGDKKRAATAATASNGGKEGKFFAEVGRERGRRKSEREKEGEGDEMGTPWGPHKRVKTGE